MFLNVQLNIDDTNIFLNVGDNIELSNVKALRKLGALFIPVNYSFTISILLSLKYFDNFLNIEYIV
jgi:hypothetical protein